jgi:hypothetical protein
MSPVINIPASILEPFGTIGIPKVDSVALHIFRKLEELYLANVNAHHHGLARITMGDLVGFAKQFGATKAQLGPCHHRETSPHIAGMAIHYEVKGTNYSIWFHYNRGTGYGWVSAENES